MRYRSILGCFLLSCLCISGCASKEPEPIRLIVISPHRDEIREEVGIAFPKWLVERVESRLDACRVALEASAKDPSPSQKKATEQAFVDLFRDWSEGDWHQLRASFRSWQEQPDSNSIALLRSLEQAKRESPRVQLVWVDVGGGTSAIMRYVGARFDADPNGIGIDVLFGGGTDLYLRFADQGRLAPIGLPASLLARIPAEFHGIPLYDQQGRWFGPMLSSFGILYNREVLRRMGKPEPRRWEDLGKPELNSWVSAGDPRLSGSIHMVYEIILQGRGWEDGFRSLLRMGASTHSFIRDSGTLTRTVSSAEVAAAGNLDANALSAVGRDPHNMAFVLPEIETITRPDGTIGLAGGTVINPDSIAVLKGAPRKELARAFVEFTMSDAGQLLFLLRPGEPGGPQRYPLCRLSVVEELYKRYPPSQRSVGDANPFANRNVLQYQSNLGNRRWDALNDLFGAVIIDAHPDLSAAWRAILSSQLPEENRAALQEELFQPPCTEAELMEHAKTIATGSPRDRLRRVNTWGENARVRYGSIRKRAEGG